MNATQSSLWEIQEPPAPASDLPPFVDLPISWAGGERSLDELARVILGDLQVTQDKKHFYQILATGIVGDKVVAHCVYLCSVRAFFGGKDDDQPFDDEEKESACQSAVSLFWFLTIGFSLGSIFLCTGTVFQLKLTVFLV